MVGPVIQLKCTCNEYPWGRVGEESMAARLCSKTNKDFKIDSKTPYSEMWFGTYPVQPSYVLETGESLQDVLNANAGALIGPTVLEKFSTDLPFLPKILSIAKALPLQIHPNRSLSHQIHKTDPEKFTDDNHKPEIAVALGPFEVFAGFKYLDDVKALLELKPLQQFKQEGYPEFNSEALRDVTWAMLKAKEDTVRSVVKELGSMSKSDFPKEAQYIVDILPRLNEQYGEQDNGTLVALICMNFLTMDAGDALFVPADGIHAYLSGDIVECMARSNNVLNTGFCPAPDRDDIDLFAKTLTFKSVSKDEMILPSEKTDKSKNGKTRQYTPALSEFNMLVTSLEKGDTEEVKSVAGPSTLIVTSGKGVMKVGSEKYDLGEGCIYFIGQGIDVSFESDEGLVAYRAYAE